MENTLTSVMLSVASGKLGRALASICDQRDKSIKVLTGERLHASHTEFVC